jgi:hypothetical protein
MKIRVKPVKRINTDGAMERMVSAAMITTEVDGLCRPPKLMFTDGVAVATSGPVISRPARAGDSR